MGGSELAAAVRAVRPRRIAMVLIMAPVTNIDGLRKMMRFPAEVIICYTKWKLSQEENLLHAVIFLLTCGGWCAFFCRAFSSYFFVMSQRVGYQFFSAWL